MKPRATPTRDSGQIYALEANRPYSFASAFRSSQYGTMNVCLQIVRTGFNIDVQSEGAEFFIMNPLDARNLARQLQTAADDAAKERGEAERTETNRAAT